MCGEKEAKNDVFIQAPVVSGLGVELQLQREIAGQHEQRNAIQSLDRKAVDDVLSLWTH